MLSRFSPVQLFVTLWTVALQALLSMGFSRQEYWSGLPCHPGDLPNPGSEPTSEKIDAYLTLAKTISCKWRKSAKFGKQLEGPKEMWYT